MHQAKMDRRIFTLRGSPKSGSIPRKIVLPPLEIPVVMAPNTSDIAPPLFSVDKITLLCNFMCGLMCDSR